jgi:hypothetical protein
MEDYCLSMVLAAPAALAIANDALEQQGLSGLAPTDFKQGENRNIFKVVQVWTASESPTIELLNQRIDPTLTSRLKSLEKAWRQMPETPPQRIQKELTIAILRLRLQNVDEQITELSFLQEEAIKNQNDQGARAYTEMGESVRRQRQKLDHARNGLSITGQRRAETAY